MLDLFYLVILQRKIVIYSIIRTNVRRALICLLNEEEKVSSWGITNINIEENSINFDVDGFLFRGHISIKCEETYFEIQMEGGKNIMCVVSELTDTLDSSIEKAENYQQNLEKWLLSFK